MGFPRNEDTLRCAPAVVVKVPFGAVRPTAWTVPIRELAADEGAAGVDRRCSPTTTAATTTTPAAMAIGIRRTRESGFRWMRVCGGDAGRREGPLIEILLNCLAY